MESVGNKSSIQYKNSISNAEFIAIPKTFFHGGRFCLHDIGCEDLQLMIIYSKPMAYYKTHRHTDKDEYYILLSGRLELLVFHDSEGGGKMAARIVMSDECEADLRTYKMPKGIWHAVSTGPEGAVFIEAKGGSWDVRRTEFVEDLRP